MSRSDEPREPSADEEAAALRHARFGTLPPRIRPDEYLEAAETDQPLGLLLSDFDKDRWATRYAGG